jgi:hypothetical protein
VVLPHLFVKSILISAASTHLWHLPAANNSNTPFSAQLFQPSSIDFYLPISTFPQYGIVERSDTFKEEDWEEAEATTRTWTFNSVRGGEPS